MFVYVELIIKVTNFLFSRCFGIEVVQFAVDLQMQLH